MWTIPNTTSNFSKYLIFRHDSRNRWRNEQDSVFLRQNIGEPAVACTAWFMGSFNHPDSHFIKQWEITPSITPSASSYFYWSYLTLKCSLQPKPAWWFWCNLLNASIVEKIFEGEMLIRTLPTTLLQIFCNISCNSKVIVKSIIDPDNNFRGPLKHQ